MSSDQPFDDKYWNLSQACAWVEYRALRANKSETIEWLKFTLEGVGERTHGYAFEDTAF
jgi:hypothetical protein